MSPRLRSALVVSTVAHALVLASLALAPAGVPVRRAPGAAFVVSLDAPGPARPTADREAPLETRPSIGPAPARPAAVRAPASAAPPTPDVVPTSAPPARSTASDRALPAPMPGDATEPEQYRMVLAFAARRLASDRAVAAEGGAREATIRVAVERRGAPADVALDASSGADALDEAALALVRATVAAHPVPPALATRVFSLRLKILLAE